MPAREYQPRGGYLALAIYSERRLIYARRARTYGRAGSAARWPAGRCSSSQRPGRVIYRSGAIGARWHTCRAAAGRQALARAVNQVSGSLALRPSLHATRSAPLVFVLRQGSRVGPAGRCLTGIRERPWPALTCGRGMRAVASDCAARIALCRIHYLLQPRRRTFLPNSYARVIYPYRCASCTAGKETTTGGISKISKISIYSLARSGRRRVAMGSSK